MSESEQQTFSPGHRFWVAFVAVLAVITALNVASYFFFSTPDEAAKFGQPKSHKVGFPRVFWIEDKIGLNSRINNPNRRYKPFESEFYWGAFLLDLVLGCGIGIGVGQWYQKRGEPSAAASEQPSSTPTLK
ncbi:MAG TPA: hypothetical protein VIW67_06855 [Terriglobales bacterium]|jgi:hypothetical protein